MAIYKQKRFGIISEYKDEDYVYDKTVILSNNNIVFLYRLLRDMEDVQPHEQSARAHLMEIFSSFGVENDD